MASRAIELPKRGRGFVRFWMRGDGVSVPCRAFFRSLRRGERVSVATLDAAADFELRSGEPAQYAYIAQIPSGAQDGVEVSGVMLLRAAWVPDGYVAVIGNHLQVRL